MAKTIEYPRASFKNALTMAKAVNDLGGKATSDMVADQMGKKPSGAFTALVGAAVKYRLITSKKGTLESTQLYRDIHLAYDEREKRLMQQQAFLAPPTFSAIFERFKNLELPINHFEKLLIREFEVGDKIASRIASYFIEGARQTGLLGEGNILSTEEATAETTISSEELDNSDDSELKEDHEPVPRDTAPDTGKYSVRITGPGMDSLIVLEEAEDLAIVSVMLKKVEKRLEEHEIFD